MSRDVKILRVISLVVILFASLYSLNVHAQKSTGSSFDQSVYYQGDSGALTITITNNHSSFQITTKQCYLQFDWQQAQNTAYISGDTPIIASGQSYTFSISFNIPNNIAVGSHSYKVVWVDKGILVGSVTVDSGYIDVHDAYEKVFLSQQSTISSELNSASFSSSDAKSFLTQALSAYQQATALANQGKYQDAINDLGTIPGLLSQAQAAEAAYTAANSSYQTILQSVQTKLNTATSASYKSPDAQSYLSQAQTYYSQATTSASSGQLQDANNKLTSASNLLDQAAAAEKSYVSNPTTLGGNPQLWYVVVAGIIVVAVAALIFIRRGKSSKDVTSVKAPLT